MTAITPDSFTDRKRRKNREYKEKSRAKIKGEEKLNAAGLCRLDDVIVTREAACTAYDLAEEVGIEGTGPMFNALLMAIKNNPDFRDVAVKKIKYYVRPDHMVFSQPVQSHSSLMMNSLNKD